MISALNELPTSSGIHDGLWLSVVLPFLMAWEAFPKKKSHAACVQIS